MGSAAHTVCALLCFWVSGSCLTLLTVGPCTVNRETVSGAVWSPTLFKISSFVFCKRKQIIQVWNDTEAAYDCSKKRLTSVPQHIWMNVTELDLSDNLLDLTHTDIVKQLNLFSNLITLNLSGNYLPLLSKYHFSSLPSLKILDLSRCELGAVEENALIQLPSLQMLFLGKNQLQGSLLLANPKAEGMADDDHNNEEGYSMNVNHGAFLRKLLAQDEKTFRNLTEAGKLNGTRTDDASKSSSYSWKVFVAVLVSAICLSIVIALTAKCKLVHKYLASYRHSRLSEADATSQCDPANFEVGFSSHGGPGTRAAMSTDDVEEDDDGFIEDNYIQASESERAARAAKLNEDDDDDDDEEEDEIQFTIG